MGLERPGPHQPTASTLGPSVAYQKRLLNPTRRFRSLPAGRDIVAPSWHKYQDLERIMWDAEVQRFTRHCSQSGRSLQPGETYYSALIPQAGSVQRRDYAAEAWPGPPANALGWWRSTVPDPKSRRPGWAPSDVILHFFMQLEDAPSQADMRYVLALFLLRRRLVKLDQETTVQGERYLRLTCPKLAAEFEVRVTEPQPQRIAEIQQQLSELLDGNENS
jgi:hypothetical protein